MSKANRKRNKIKKRNHYSTKSFQKVINLDQEFGWNEHIYFSEDIQNLIYFSSSIKLVKGTILTFKTISGEEKKFKVLSTQYSSRTKNHFAFVTEIPLENSKSQHE